MDLLDRRAAESPERVVYRFLGDGPGEASITFGELAREAAVIGRMPQDGTQPGDRVPLLFPPRSFRRLRRLRRLRRARCPE